jgi:hypothetical protein
MHAAMLVTMSLLRPSAEVVASKSLAELPGQFWRGIQLDDALFKLVC